MSVKVGTCIFIIICIDISQNCHVEPCLEYKFNVLLVWFVWFLFADRRVRRFWEASSQSLNGNEPVIKWNKCAGHVTHLDFDAKHESQSSFKSDQY